MITITESKMFFASSRNADGSAYGRPEHHTDDELAQVGPGTPCGELMRRYWQPFAQSSALTATPQNVRLLGEDLIMFRDGQGRPGILTPRCVHRGTSLYYGKVDDHGIRCCYHGWQFDVEGNCIDQPCEPVDSNFKTKVRQPWYPVEERYGLAFVYMGPPERKPLLPRWDILEAVGADEMLMAIGPSGIGVGGDESVKIVPWGWLQDYENTMDPFHVPILHASFTEVHFTPEMAIMTEETFAAILPVMPFDTEEEAVHLANSSIFGLSACVFSRNIERAKSIAAQLHAGAVSINDASLTAIVHDAAKQSFKASGLGGSRMGAPSLQRFYRQQAFMIKDGGADSPWWYPKAAEPQIT
jgi:nitrite reductase/ring-hydroxylating ferredoxin subunit